MILKNIFLSLVLMALPSVAAFAGLTFEGLNSPAITVTPQASTGLEAVYVLENTINVVIAFDGQTSVKWSRFGSSGAAYAVEIGISPSIAIDAEDAGYIAEFDGRQHYFWIVNYADHPLSLQSVTESAESSDCMTVMLDINGDGQRINYYTINGRQVELSRDINVKYYTLVYDADSHTYRQELMSDELSYIHSPLAVTASLCDTRYVIEGDRFLREWNIDQQIETPVISARSVAAETSAEQDRREVDNEQSSDTGELGGSAPCEISFSAVATDAAVFYEWQLSKNADFDPIDDRYPQYDLTYTFRDQGTTYVRFFAADASGVCEYVSPTYNVNIGASSLLCPNAFTPESSPGINDEWKVSYKSIVEFECHIFNRWGTELFSFTDPSIGWDGKYKGKYVPAGVYYYVIKARGADGREYKLSGDINIIKSKDTYNTSDQD